MMIEYCGSGFHPYPILRCDTVKCRHCQTDLQVAFIDLGSAPPSNAYLTEAKLKEPEIWYPLKVLVCTNCWLVQTEDHAAREELFSEEYAYFSSFSSTWQAHVKGYVEEMVKRFSLGEESFVVEVASNDGCLLSFVKQRGIPCLGIEPTKSTAKAARQRGLDVIEDFFGSSLAQELVEKGRKTDLIAANNVLAHVPDINDFARAFAILLEHDGVATFEFPHLLKLVTHKQFDTIYHEHYSYLSLTAVQSVFNEAGLKIFDVEELEIHGGSLRVYACRQDSTVHKQTERVEELLITETSEGMNTVNYYTRFQKQADKAKNDLLAFLIESKERNLKLSAYGAAAKGNTLLNYAGVRPDLLPFVVDLNPAKQGKFLPGSRITVVSEDLLHKERPDYVIILPWNIKEEIMNQLSYIRDWGGKFVTAIPELREW